MNQRNSIKILFLGCVLFATSIFAMETNNISHSPKTVRQRHKNILKIEKPNFYKSRSIVPGDCCANFSCCLSFSLVVGFLATSQFFLNNLGS